MGLTKYGLAVGIGYHFGRPDGRQQLLWLRQQIIDLARAPAVRNLRERGWDIAGECALAAKNLAAEKLPGKSKVADAAVPQGRNRGLRVRSWRRPRPYPAAPPTAATPMDTADRAAAAAGSPADGAAPTGFGGRTVAEDSQAAITGTSAPPPVGRVPPTVPRPDRP